MGQAERHRLYRERHPDRMREASRRWRERNPNYRREWYQKNKAKVRAHHRERYIANRQAVLDFKGQAGCLDCGETDKRVLQFDHVPERGPKRYNIPPSLRFDKMGPVLREELKKCDVVCANCHSRRTWARRYPDETPDS